MANREQVRRLKAGVEAWNAWRQENSETRIDLRGAKLNGLSLQNVNLAGADIRGSNFSKANLTGANFAGVKAGLQKHWLILLILVAFLGAVISGVFASCNGYLIRLILGNDSDILWGVGSFTILILLYILLLQKGFNAYAYAYAGLGAGAFAVILEAAFAGAGPGTTAVAIAILGAAAFAFLGAVSILVATAIWRLEAGVFAGVTEIGISILVARAFTGVFGGAGAGTLALGCISVSTSAYVGWCALAGDEKYAVIRSLAVAFAATGGTQFREANLTDADFWEAQLKSTDFRHAILTRTQWHRSKQLDRARCGGTILDKAVVRDLAVTHKGINQSYVGQNLKGISLRDADLRGANLLEADISDATLEGAFLEAANLTKVQALRTRFQQATLTAACLEAWNIDSTTELEGVICNHVYLLNNQQERRPNSGSFAPDEFTKLFEEVLDTIDLIFRDGVDWKAFVATFRDIQVQNDDSALAIQSIENKGDGVVVVKVKASDDADKAKIHAEFSATYELKRQALEAQYRTQLEAKDSEITSYRRENANMMEITKLLANKPINVEAKAMSSSKESTNHFNAPVSGIVGSSFTDNAQVSGNSFNQTNTTRDTSSPEPEVPSTTILFLAANPTSLTKLRLETELREIDESLKRSQQRDQFTLINKGSVRSRDFYRAILDTQPKIVHFSGHGTEIDGLALEDDQGNATFMGAEQLEAQFEMFAEEGVECVLLNACYSKKQAQAIRQHIPYVIGMSRAITDRAATEFAVAFYDSLGAGKDITFAFKLAKSQLIPLGAHKIPELL